MKIATLILIVCFGFIIVTSNGQTITGTELKVVHTTLAENGDNIRFYRADTNSDYGRLRLALGDEEYSDFEIGHNFYQNGEWRPVFSLDGGGNSWMKGSMGLGVGAYSLSKIHAKSPAVTEWGVMVEASPNRRVIGLGHDGTNGIISVGVMDGAAGFSPLEFRTNNLSRMLIGVDGKVGIGTNTPADQLEIVSANKKVGFNTAIPGVTNGGVVSVSRSDGFKIMYLGSSNSPQDDPVIFGSGGATEMRLVSAGGSSEGFGFYINTNVTTAFGPRSALSKPVVKITGDGKLGIGTTTPDQKLTVKGKVHAEEVIIDLAVPAPDYVFEQNYSLTPLDEVQAYIAQHKHLPEVPSAKQMEQEGVKVGEMEMILLKKMEEMTLYMIELRKEKNELAEQVKQLTEEVTEMKNKKQ